jgi:hypothetical protein
VTDWRTTLRRQLVREARDYSAALTWEDLTGLPYQSPNGSPFLPVTAALVLGLGLGLLAS